MDTMNSKGKNRQFLFTSGKKILADIKYVNGMSNAIVFKMRYTFCFEWDNERVIEE